MTLRVFEILFAASLAGPALAVLLSVALLCVPRRDRKLGAAQRSQAAVHA
jgi:hypothetical protein